MKLEKIKYLRYCLTKELRFLLSFLHSKEQVK